MAELLAVIWFVCLLLTLGMFLAQIPQVLHVKRSGRISQKYHVTFITLTHSDARSHDLFEASGDAHEHGMEVLDQKSFFKVVLVLIVVMWVALVGQMVLRA